MGCARWTYEPEEAVLKSAPRMDWVVRLLFYFAAGNETAVPYHQETLAERTWLVVEIAAVSWRAGGRIVSMWVYSWGITSFFFLFRAVRNRIITGFRYICKHLPGGQIPGSRRSFCDLYPVYEIW